MVNMPLSQLFWDLYQASNLKWDHFVHKIEFFFQFKHLLGYLCSIVTKILAHVILKLIKFSFYSNKKKSPNISGIQFVLTAQPNKETCCK